LPNFGGIHAPVRLTEGGGEALRYTMTLKLNGTGQLYFAPVGRDTSVALHSDWPHPKFDGAFLPDEPSDDITAEGFKRQWTVPYLRRSLSQEMVSPENLSHAVSATSFGVKFYKPVDHYQLVDRALKYAILFVGLSFLAFFLIEVLTGARVHAVQYLLVGAAQVLFYLLLLSVAEHRGFEEAYLWSSAATVGLTFLYAMSAFRSWFGALIVLGVLILLYGLLFMLLREEDYALLVGAMASFAILAVTMFVTRKIDWYQAAQRAPA
jgi:inner membrane protein